MNINNLLVIPLLLFTFWTVFTEVAANCAGRCRDKRNYLAKFCFSQSYLSNIYYACMRQCSHSYHGGSQFIFGHRATTTHAPLLWTHRPTNPTVVWTPRKPHHHHTWVPPTNPIIVWTPRPTNPTVVWTPNRTNPPIHWTTRETNPTVIWTPKRTFRPVYWTTKRTFRPAIWTTKRTFRPVLWTTKRTFRPIVWTTKRTFRPVIWTTKKPNPPIVWTPKPTFMPHTTPQSTGPVRPSQYGCGFKREFSNRIIGGVPVEPCEHPWMVVVRTPGLFCGGSIIDKRHILTAAHCIKNRFSGVVASPSQVVVKIGSSRLTRLRKVKVSKIHVHRKHNIFRDYDIAVLTLERELMFGPCIAPVCIPTESQRAEDMDECVVTGWGIMDPRGIDHRQPDVMRKVNVDIVDRKKCMASYGGLHFNDLKICAGNYRQGGQDSCKGDSGGPLMCRHKNGPYSVFGIVSFGNQCAKPLFPGVYTRVNHPLITQFVIESINDVGQSQFS